MRYFIFVLILMGLVCGQPAISDTIWASYPYSIASWDEPDHGNHRVIVNVARDAAAVQAHIIWRRHDSRPDEKAIVIEDSTGKRVQNIVVVRVNNEYGDVIFQPISGSGLYYVYYMPTQASFGAGKTLYLPSRYSPDPVWAALVGTDKWKSLPEAIVTGMQARQGPPCYQGDITGSFHSFYPMEIIATRAETARVLKDNPLSDYLVFMEDRRYPVKMSDYLSCKWAMSGSVIDFTGEVAPGEVYPFQIGMYACRKSVKISHIACSDFVGSGGKIPASAFRCINLEGNDWKGHPFKRSFSLAKGKVGSMWVWFRVPNDASGRYKGHIDVTPVSGSKTRVNVTIDVKGEPIGDGCFGDIWRLSRIAWLDSLKGVSNDPVPPYTDIVAAEDTASILNRQITFSDCGMPKKIVSNGRNVLARPMACSVMFADGKKAVWKLDSDKVLSQTKGTYVRQWKASSGPLSMNVTARLEFDGYLNYTINLAAKRDTRVRDVSLAMPVARDVARYMMGMGKRGGFRPASWNWQWSGDFAQNMVWIGDYNAGIQLKLTPQRDLYNYDVAEAGLPESWYNTGKGGCSFHEESESFTAKAYSGARTIKAGTELTYGFRLMITPFRPIDKRHWQWRTAHNSGLPYGNAMHLHHASYENPYINYPFVYPDRITALRLKLENGNGRYGAKKWGLNLYYTCRELSNHVYEMWLLRSIADEVFATTSYSADDSGGNVTTEGGGHAWLQEHLEKGYAPGWQVNLSLYGLGDDYDSAFGTKFGTRWLNYYVEGIDWLMKNTFIDGIYLDGIGFDRETMKRVVRVMGANNPNFRIQYHALDFYPLFNTGMSTLNLTIEHLPYVTQLWCGEVFDFSMPPDFWFVEMSGIPFGVTADMLNYAEGGNAYRGMLYGMYGRGLPCVESLTYFWDDFGIQEANMIGYWQGDCPVRTGRDDILATVYTKQKKALISIGSWAETEQTVNLNIDWAKLGLNPSHSRIYAPAITGFQDARSFAVGEAIHVAPAKGWLLVVEEEENR